MLYRIGKPRIAPRNKTDGRINKYGVNLSREGDFPVLCRNFLADREFIDNSSFGKRYFNR
jgi:hypothetical protein